MIKARSHFRHVSGQHIGQRYGQVLLQGTVRDVNDTNSSRCVSFFCKDEFIMHRKIWMSQICYAHNCRAVQKMKRTQLVLGV
jgi:hypothetical protein